MAHMSVITIVSNPSPRGLDLWRELIALSLIRIPTLPSLTPRRRIQSILVLVPLRVELGLLLLVIIGLPHSTRGGFLTFIMTFTWQLFSRNSFGVTIAGEWSVALNDCGLYVDGVGSTSDFAGGCTQWQDSSNWTDGMKAGLMNVALASMDALRDWFFWTWKVKIHIKSNSEWKLT